MMDRRRHVIDDIVSRFSRLDPYRIILFGSQASGNVRDDSDIDLFVVLDSDAISRSYHEKMAKKLSVRNQILDLSETVAVDLVVYTKAEYKILKEANGSFLKEIERTGKTLYEKTGAGVA
jgi:predicted nucleotidyltransferase